MAERKARLETHVRVACWQAPSAGGLDGRGIRWSRWLMIGMVGLGLGCAVPWGARLLAGDRRDQAGSTAMTSRSAEGETWPFPPEGAEMRALPRTAAINGPFVIVGPRSGMERHYAIWVQDWYTGTLVSTFYLRSGEVIEAELPLGTYRLAFAVGQGWQGHKLLFGATTTITRAEHPFVIALANRVVVGFRLILDDVAGGDIVRHPAAHDEF